MKDEISIEHLAKLARMKVSEEEKEKLTKDFSGILAYISKLQEVDTSNFEAKAYLTDQVNVFAEDEVEGRVKEKENVINSFPKQTGNALEVPGVFE